MWELTKGFGFEAAHTVQYTLDTEQSRRIHGHSYRAEVTVRGIPDATTGMIVDLGLFERTLQDARDALDHRFLNDVPELGPATMENLAAWIWRRVAPALAGLAIVTVRRDSTSDICRYFGSAERVGNQ